MESKTTRIDIRTDEKFKDNLMTFCDSQNISISDFLRMAALEAMNDEKNIRERVRKAKIEMHRAKKGIVQYKHNIKIK